MLKFSKSSQNILAKYLSADGCFVKTNTINCDDNDNAMFPNTRAFAFTRQLWNEILLEALERSICVAARPFCVD